MKVGMRNGVVVLVALAAVSVAYAATVKQMVSCPHCGKSATVEIPDSGSGTKSGIAHSGGCNKTFGVRYENGQVVRVDK